MKIQKSGTRILAMLLSFSIIFSGMPAQAGYLDNQTVFASSDSTQQEEFFSGSENGISVDDLTKVIESDRTEITQVLIKEEDSVKDIEVSEENEISNDTEVSEDNGISNNTEISGDNGVSNDTEVSEDNEISNDTEVSEDNEISNDTEISGDNGISNDTEVSEDNEITEDAEVSENSEVSEEEKIVYENFGDWSFEILNESDAVLTAYNGEDTDIIIPNTVEANGTQYDVVELAEEIFKYNNEITSVTFGSKLIAIGEGAFENCENLTTVDMSPAVELISTGSAAFRGCISLVSITYSDSQEIVSENAFAGCSSLVSNEFGPSITTIGAGAFEYCTSLKNVNLTDTIIIIERYAFSHCSAIERVDFPDSITSIGLEAFSYCDNLSEVAYPINYKISLCEFGEDYAWLLDGYRGHIFLGCSKLHKIVIPEGTKRIAPYAFADCTSINEIILPESLEGIDRSAFENCTGIKTIELPESLERIEAFTFYGCTGMETIELKSNLKSIGGHAFEKSGLTDLTLPANIITIEEGAFQDAAFLKTIAFSEGLNRIESYAFMGCSSLEKLELPDSVTEIGYKAFANCESVSAANLPKNYSNSICKEYNDNSLDAVGDNGNLFYGCKNLKTVTIPEGMELLPPYVFANCSYLETISFPESMKTISRYAFYNCSGLTEVNFTDGLTVIGPHAFEKATAVKELILPKNLETIGDTALCGMSSLESISFNSSLKVIQSYALKGNISLKEIKIPKNVTDIGYQAFADCINLRSFGYPEGYVRSLCKDSNDEFWTFEDSMGNIISGCTKLNVLEIPEGVEYIPRFAFANCQNLKYVTIPDSVITIGKFAFYNCDALSEIIMGKQTAIISENAFEKCSGIEAASFSISTSYIGDAAFNGCDNLGEVYYEGTQMQWNEITIGEENSSFGNANFHFEADGSEYTSVLSQPRLTAEANGHKQMKLSWTYEGDQAAVRSYVLYRSEDGVNFKIVGAMDADANEYLDSVSFTGKSKTYYYKISVYDKYDRSETSEVISCKAVANDTSKPNAVISLAGLNYAQAGDAFYVSGGLSNDNDSIASYDWDFGDGTMETGTDTSHIYQTPGEYTVSLTVTDINGNKEKTTASVNVVEIGNESDYTKISLSVCDATSLGAVPNAQVMIKQGENSRLISSDKTGNVQFVVPNGDYIVSVTAEGYTLRTMKINATGKAFSQTIGLLKGSIMSSEFTVTELTYDEIVAAGIDVTAEGNQHVYKFAATFTFVAGLKEYDFPYFVLKNENGETVGISGSGSITFKDIDGYDISINIKPLSEKFVLVIYGEAHWLKEMYKVELLVNNNSKMDVLEDVTASLELPQGLSLPDMINGEQSLEQKLGTVDSGESAIATWYIRGDEEGEYHISAEVSAVTMPFGDYIIQRYTTTEPIKVYAGSALHLTITCPDVAERGSEYMVNFRLENVSEKSLYNLSFGLTGSEQYKVISYGRNNIKSQIVSANYGDKWTHKVKELAPGGYIELNLSTTIWFNSLLELVELTKLGSFVDIAYYLTDVSVVTMEGSTTEIPYTIEVERAERDSLLDKVVEGFVGKALEKAGVELPSGSLGGTLIYLAEKQLGFTIPLGGVLELQQGSTNHVLTITADDGRGVGDSIYNDVVRVNTGDGSNQLVDVLNGTKYEVSPLGLSIEAKGLGGTSFKIGMEDSLGNLQKEYTLNLTTTNDIYNDTLVVEADKETHTVQVNEEQFTASVKKLNDETLEHYKENPFVTVKSGLEIEVSEQTQTTSSHVIMKSAQLDQIEDSVITDVVIHTQNGSLDFDRETLNQLNEAKEDITVSLEKYVESESGDAYGFDDKPTYIFTTRNSKGKIVKFVNNVGVSIPYELQNPNANILIKHGLDDGDVEYLTAVYDPKEKNIYFETGSFSSFTIIETNSEIAEDGSVYYSISFNGNGGAVRLASASDIASGNNISGNVVSSNDVSENLISGNKVYTLKVSYNGIFGKMPIAEKEGYTFAGWFTEPVSGNQIKTGDKLLADGDMILYAHFKAKSASDNSASDNNVSDNNVSDNSTSDNNVSDNNVSDNNVSDNNVSDNNVSGNTIQLTLDFGDATVSSPIKTVTIGEKYGDALPTAKDIVTLHGELFCGWYNEKGELITAGSIAKKEDGKLTARFEKRTIVVKQQMAVGDFFETDLAAYEKYIAELGAADGKDYSKKLKFKYVVHTESAQDAKLIPNTKKSDNKLATVSLKKNAVTGKKTGILTAKKSGVAKVSLLTQRLVDGKWTYVEGETYLYVAIEKAVPKAKKFTLTYIGQELAIDHVLGYEYSDKLGYDPNIAEVKYQPSKDGIIKVDPVTGRVEAVKTGSVKLIITYTTELPTGKTSTVKVSIPVYVKIPGFKVKPEGVTMKAGKSKKTTLRNTLKEETVTYTSGDTEIAAVDEKGKVTGVKAGTTEITATVLSADGHKDTYSYKVTVTE